VLGAGLAGLSAALAALGCGRKVLLLAAAPLGEGCSSAWAQGGVAVALSPDDSAALHAADTVEAGAGLVDPGRASLLAAEGPAAVRRLIAWGAPFDRDAQGRLLQSLEAAHSRPRVARVGGDGAGRAIMAAVIERAKREERLELLEGVRAEAVLRARSGRVVGVLARGGGRRLMITAEAVVLATGGLGGLYAVTTNPAQLRGEGLALAAAAGAAVADPEFVQFHPTALDFGLDPAPLATEALRGEGAILVDAVGEPFMAAYDRRGDLAPRDVVARAIHAQLLGGRGAFLDARQAVGEHFPSAFPQVFAACAAAGLDPRRAPMPVAPAAHYHMGGVLTDEEGRTSLEGLYAVGECASTGVHGANRLASNSLLEAAVFGKRAGRAAAADAASSVELSATAEPTAVAVLPPAELAGLRRRMSADAGVLRTGAGLKALGAEIARLEDRHGSALELIAAGLVVRGALERLESRGAHHREDHPGLSAARRTVLTLEPQSAA
jgi:L-aspartate oxidase